MSKDSVLSVNSHCEILIPGLYAYVPRELHVQHYRGTQLFICLRADYRTRYRNISDRNSFVNQHLNLSESPSQRYETQSALQLAYI